MKKTKLLRRNITLIEIIIVMFFITIITGVVAYNIKGALDEGKAFKTLEGIKQLETVLSMEIENNDKIDPEDLANYKFLDELKQYQHPLVKNWDALVKDGWGVRYIISYDEEYGTITITSKKFDLYQKDHPSSLFKQ
ncbi:MAG: general secretion pathway protein GspG [Waddliaceae bacterium]|jgi:general secretion pathway protein G|nr:general secretion pathway protein GspG [Waddliaceae bacterium]MBT3579617.1 general secretion pathway protein GspG [Waddliaceae bacterium]MBT4444617.1 general secretion pathway protein GspG [Waddliaceae bacterium]MBT6928138.1 general secretion pathway protein GspG [Waddliaceae bacterium]MBT7462131.1 general secretion pathway protein GspG [Waddliaceae bacterium]